MAEPLVTTEPSLKSALLLKAPLRVGSTEALALPAPPAETTIDLSTARMTVTDLDPLGRKISYSVELPQTANYEEMTMPQKILVLKSGRFSKLPVPLVMAAITYAARLRKQTGADIDELQGDLYAISSQSGELTFNLTNDAKWKIAMATGLIEGWESILKDIPDEPGPEGCDEPYDIECTVTLLVKGLKSPIVCTQRLTEWYMGRNPNWQHRARHMLEKSTRVHAAELISKTSANEDSPDNGAALYTPKPDSKFAEVAGTDTDKLVDKLAASVEAARSGRVIVEAIE